MPNCQYADVPNLLIREGNALNERPYHIELYYGYQECESGIYHAFDAVDPQGKHDDEKMAVKLSDTLDTTPDDANFHYNSMHILLPASVVAKIRADAVNDFLTSVAEGTDGGNHIPEETGCTEYDHQEGSK